VLSINETLKNAQKTLFEDLKIAKIEHVIIQQLINQIERAKANLDLNNETSVLIDQMQTKKNFDFASIDLTKKSNKMSSYCETMFENFQQLEKTLKLKMTKLMTEQVEKKLIQSQSRLNLETSRKSVLINARTQSDTKEMSQTSKMTQTARNNLALASASEKSRTKVLRPRPQYEYATPSHLTAALNQASLLDSSNNSSVNRIFRFIDHAQILSERAEK
jgi:hypothetical protein